MSTEVLERPAVQRVHPPNWLMKVVKPAVRKMLARGRPAAVVQQVALLHFIGRRSGKQYDVPAGWRMIRGRMAVLTSSGWRVNFRGGQDFHVTLQGVRRAAHGELLEDPDDVVAVYRELLDALGWKASQRQFGIRINVDRSPTDAELRAMIEQSGLSILWIDLQNTISSPKGPS